MEPDLGGQEKDVIRKRPSWILSWSQWSLTLEVRKSRRGFASVGTTGLVAMEPDLGGQEKPQPR